MFTALKYSLALILSLSISAFAAESNRIADPDKFSGEVVKILAASDTKRAAKMIAENIGKPESLDALQKFMQIFEGKRFDFSKKVIDQQYEGALRQIVYYSYIDNAGFVYFRFNFKMTSTGWILAHFIFKDETNELFPKDFVTQ